MISLWFVFLIEKSVIYPGEENMYSGSDLVHLRGLSLCCYGGFRFPFLCQMPVSFKHRSTSDRDRCITDVNLSASSDMTLNHRRLICGCWFYHIYLRVRLIPHIPTNQKQIITGWRKICMQSASMRRKMLLWLRREWWCLRICNRAVRSTPSQPPAVIVSISSHVCRRTKKGEQCFVEQAVEQCLVLTVFRVRFFLHRLHSPTLRLFRP